MSSSDRSGPAYPFYIGVEGLGAEDCQIAVFNGWQEEVGRDVERVDLHLPRGLYTVRLERAGELVETTLRHAGPTRETLPAPLRRSSTPLFDTATTHEYYAYTSAELSKRDTRSPLGNPIGGEGRLLLFVRAISAEHYGGEDLLDQLLLADRHGVPISTFDDVETERSNDGWACLSAVAEPGPYYLHDEGRTSREMVLHVQEGLSTQLFVTYNRGLRFETGAILMPDMYQGFDPDDPIARAVDAALGGLQVGRDWMPREAMQLLLHGKFHDPMLGVLGAHILLLRREPPEDTLATVLGNLDGLLPESPDVAALRLLAAERLGWDAGEDPFEHPPMFRAGAEAVLRASVEMPELLPEGGLMERIATRLQVDTPWTTWDPVYVAPFTLSPDPPGHDEEEVDEWVLELLRDSRARARRVGRTPDLKQLASQTQIPMRVLEEAQESLGTKLVPVSDDLTRIGGIGPVFQGVLKDLGFETFDDLAGAQEADIQRIDTHLGRYSGRLREDGWIEQARVLLGEE